MDNKLRRDPIGRGEYIKSEDLDSIKEFMERFAKMARLRLADDDYLITAINDEELSLGMACAIRFILFCLEDEGPSSVDNGQLEMAWSMARSFYSNLKRLREIRRLQENGEADLVWAP